jgi:O-antigen biosynthesis protein WbqP
MPDTTLDLRQANPASHAKEISVPASRVTMYDRLKRAFDLIMAGLLLAAFAVPMLIIALLIRLTSPGPALYWSNRIGRGNRVFSMPKFRTMRIDCPLIATHLLSKAADYITPLGRVLRKASLDELPQLLSILKGDISFVGPRPAIYNQADLIALRTQKGVHALVPGLTGWAQINGRDELTIPEKVERDVYYLTHRSFRIDLLILFRTVPAVLRSRGVSH